MRKFSYILSCVVIGLVVTASRAEAVDYMATSPASNRPANMTKPIQETRMASREAMMPNKMATPAGQMSKKAEFKEKLQQLTDSDKQAIVEKIDTRITSTNASQTAKWMESLTKMESLLAKFTAQEATLKAAGEDTTALAAAITSAQIAVATAKTAVNTQASKEYVINITSEKALRTNVGSTVSQFRVDSRTTRQTVIAARTAVVKAATEWTKLTVDSMDTNASNSGAMRVQ